MTVPTDRLELSIVIATRDRPADLRRCLRALDALDDPPALEVIVVDDGSRPPLGEEEVATRHPTRLLRGDGRGPAAARNIGIREARAEIVLFTDDDTIPDRGWARAASEYLRAHPQAAGVEGRVWTRPYDPLYEYSLEGGGGGHYWTANVAYRVEVLRAVGGFAEDVFPHAHGEDRDLALRVLRHGAIGASDEMLVEHVPRRLGVRDFYRRALWSQSDMLLELRHPEHHRWDNPVPSRLRAAVRVLQQAGPWYVAEARTLIRSPRRLGRSIVAVAASLSGALVAAATFRPRRSAAAGPYGSRQNASSVNDSPS